MGRAMASVVSALSSCVAYGHHLVHPVSSSPSKIPYGGFSPVRLQTGLGPPPSPLGTHPPAYRRPESRSSAATVAPEGAIAVLSRRRTAVPRDRPVQRPLARQRVMLSRRVVAYYGLIRGSGPLRPTCGFRRPVFASRPRPGDSLLYSACPSVRAVCRTPADRVVRAASRPTRDSLRPSVKGSASALFHAKVGSRVGAFRGCTVRLMLRPGQLLALHRHRTFTFELSSHELPHWNVEYNYTAKQPIAVAGLAPAGQAALQAATQMGHGGAQMRRRGAMRIA